MFGFLKSARFWKYYAFLITALWVASVFVPTISVMFNDLIIWAAEGIVAIAIAIAIHPFMQANWPFIALPATLISGILIYRKWYQIKHSVARDVNEEARDTGSIPPQNVAVLTSAQKPALPETKEESQVA